MNANADHATRAIPGLDGLVPRLALGSVNLTDERPDAGFAVLDAFAERGGRLIDTALVYTGGRAERLIGRWLAARPEAARSMLVLTKGAHPDAAWRSRINPGAMRADVAVSLERLGRSPIDAWMLHRDDEAVPDALDGLVREGLVRAVGVSNWRLARVRALVEACSARGRAPIALVSNYLGLAEAAAFPWPGCVSGRDRETLAWHAETGLPFLAWSSQAGGYFAPGFDPGAVPDVVRSYGSAANEARRDRARELGVRRGWDAPQVALAWVLSAPSAPFAAFGVRAPAGIEAAFAALESPLTEAERVWLDTGEGSGWA
jgi:1-deoxyxylulose-5-phosphate synthase